MVVQVLRENAVRVIDVFKEWLTYLLAYLLTYLGAAGERRARD